MGISIAFNGKIYTPHIPQQFFSHFFYWKETLIEIGTLPEHLNYACVFFGKEH